MKVAIIDSEIVCAEIGPYYEQLRDTGRFRWNRRDKTMRARMCLDSLERNSENSAKRMTQIGVRLA